MPNEYKVPLKCKIDGRYYSQFDEMQCEPIAYATFPSKEAYEFFIKGIRREAVEDAVAGARERLEKEKAWIDRVENEAMRQAEEEAAEFEKKGERSNG